MSKILDKLADILKGPVPAEVVHGIVGAIKQGKGGVKELLIKAGLSDAEAGVAADAVMDIARAAKHVT
jgi:hypothetical protein